MATKPKAAENDAVPQPPQTTPVAIHSGMADHSFTLQAIMELQKSVGELNSTLQSVRSSVESTKSKVDDLVNWKHKILGGAAVLAAVVATLGFLAGKVSDYVTFKSPNPTPAVSIAPQLPAPQQAPR